MKVELNCKTFLRFFRELVLVNDAKIKRGVFMCTVWVAFGFLLQVCACLHCCGSFTPK